MKRLSDLPAELLSQICVMFEEDDSDDEPREQRATRKEGVLSLCLAHSTLRAAAQPVLVREFSKYAEDAALGELLRTVAECPHLRPHLTTLIIGDIQFDLPEDCEPLTDAIESLKVDFAEEWTNRLKGDHADEQADATIALFWALLPNLKRVDFSWPHASGVMMGKLISQQRIPSWSSVEDLSIMQWDPDADLILGQGMSMLSMPALQRVELRQIRTDEDISVNIQPETVHIKRLELQEVGLKPQVIQQILGSFAPSSLEHFCYRQVAFSGQESTPHELLHLLSPHSASLKSLELDFMDFHLEARLRAGSSWSALGERKASSSLPFDGFANLETLSVDQRTLDYGSTWFKLPSSLVTLTVMHGDEKVNSAIEDLAARTGQFPRLAEIRLFLGRLHNAKALGPVQRRLALRNIKFRTFLKSSPHAEPLD